MRKSDESSDAASEDSDTPPYPKLTAVPLANAVSRATSQMNSDHSSSQQSKAISGSSARKGASEESRTKRPMIEGGGHPECRDGADGKARTNNDCLKSSGSKAAKRAKTTSRKS